MTKSKKILITLIFLTIFILLGSNRCNASGDLYLKNLDFQAKINQDGSMDVIEIWDISIEDTNTLFKTFKTDRTKYTSITDVEVADITNSTEQKFQQINNLMYHVTKNCYYGLKNDKGNFEIAWGVGLDDGSARKTYKISYKVNDAIAKYNDYAELYWQFVGSDFEVSSSKITGTIILPEKASSKDEIKVWGHTEGLNGEIYATDLNKIEFEVTKFKSGRYVEIRSLFPTNMITTSGRTYSGNIYDKVISEETKWANEANLKRERVKEQKNKISIIFGIACFIIDIFLIRKSIKMLKKASQRKKINPTINVKYYREIPRKNATPSQALFIYKNTGTDFTSQEMGKIFSATLLDLSLKKYIEFENNAENKKNIIIKILKRLADEDLEASEKEVLKYILGAAANEEQITIKELEKYMKRYSTKLIDVKDDIEKQTKKELEKNNLYDKNAAREKKQYSTQSVAMGTFILTILFMGVGLIPFLIEYVYGEILFIGIISLFILAIFKTFSISKYNKKIDILTEQGLNEKEMWKGLKKYMEEFSMLDKREVPELVIWEEFLVYATVFGIADKVLKQLKVVYPDFDTLVDMDTYTYMYLMMNTNFSSNFSNAMDSAFNSAYASNYSSTYSSGSGFGGGFSGGGGGGRWPGEVEEADNASFTFFALGTGLFAKRPVPNYKKYERNGDFYEYKDNKKYK